MAKTPLWACRLIERAREERWHTLRLDVASEAKLAVVPPELVDLPELRTLGLRDQELTALADLRVALPGLERIDVAGNPLTHVVDQAGLCLDLATYRRLGATLAAGTILGLECEASGPSAAELAQLTALKRLKLIGAVSILPDWVCELRELRALDLSNTQLRTLPPTFAALTELRSLDLSGTPLTELPTSITWLRNLKTLDLSKTKLTKLPELARVETEARMPSLDALAAPHELMEFANTLRRHRFPSRLQSLDLSKTPVRELPEWIGKAMNLRSLDVSWTQLGAMPQSIVLLRKLESLNLSGLKSFKGLEWISSLTEVRVLNLSRTTLLPSRVDEPPSHTSAYGHGFFVGSTGWQPIRFEDLPRSASTPQPAPGDWWDIIATLLNPIGTLRNLESLDLSGVRITTLPSIITTLPRLQSLKLSETMLEELPESIGDLTGLRSLDLSRAPIARLPLSMTKLNQLQSLDLSRTKLTALTIVIARLTQLRSLDVSRTPLSTIPELISRLTGLRTLALSMTKLTALPKSIGQLAMLQELDVSNTNLTELPESFGELSNLRTLKLSDTSLPELPESIGQLTNLRELQLGRTPLRELPKSIADLANLRALNVSRTQLRTLPDSIGRLRALQELDLRRTQLSELPDSIGDLVELQVLDISDTSLARLPDSFVRLAALTSLNLAETHLNELPESFSELRSLVTLNLSGTPLRKLPDCIAPLTRLRALDLSQTNLSELPELISHLTQLQSLDVSRTKLRALSESIANLTELHTLRLARTPLEVLPSEVFTLPRLTSLTLFECPLPDIPQELLGKDNFARVDLDAIRKYVRQLEEQGLDYLCEAKLVLVGEPGAGKTSLARKILDPRYRLDHDKTTEGIDVWEWGFPAFIQVSRGDERVDEQRTLEVHIWDFAGQEITHATHQFFLTRRSVYALVVDERRENANLDYWLNVVMLLSDKSPLFVIKNEKQNLACTLNERAAREHFSNIRDVLATNLADNRGLEAISTALRSTITQLPHIGQPLPKAWKRVRDRLIVLRDAHNYIDATQFLAICAEQGFKRHEDKLQLSGYLHDIGTCLHFQDDPGLDGVVILKPEWVTRAVYRVLRDRDVQRAYGRLQPTDVKRIWSDPSDAPMRGALLSLMLKFRLCYPLGDTGEYIVPQLLPDNQPELPKIDADALAFFYEYPFMPKGLVPRFIAGMHRWIASQQWVWQQGVVLQSGDARAIVIEEPAARQIRVRAWGDNRLQLLGAIRKMMEDIHAPFRGLVVGERIPCRCSECSGSDKPFFFNADTVRTKVKKGTTLLQCHLSDEMVQTVELLRAVGEYYDDGGARQLSEQRDVEPDLRRAELPLGREVFISYKRSDPSEALAVRIEQVLDEDGVTVIRDKRELGYKDDIHSFMERLSEGSCVICILSDGYLRSHNCMRELVALMRHEDASARIFPIVMPDASIYEPDARVGYVKYWQDKRAELNAQIRALPDHESLDETHADVKLIGEIAQDIDRLTGWLRRTNALAVHEHESSEFDALRKTLALRMFALTR